MDPSRTTSRCVLKWINSNPCRENIPLMSLSRYHQRGTAFLQNRLVLHRFIFLEFGYGEWMR